MTPPLDISISVSIVTFSTPIAVLSKTLESVVQALEHIRDKELTNNSIIYLIDNSEHGLTDNSQLQELANQDLPANMKIRFVSGQGNVGYGSGHNLSLNEDGCSYHLLLNPDVFLEKTCLLKGLNYLAENSDVALIGPCAVDEAGNNQYLCKRYPSALIFLLRGFMPEIIKRMFSTKLDEFEMKDLALDESSKNIPILSGCFMLGHKDKLISIQGFDERYFLYFEDFDLSLRMSQIGSLAYVPSMKITHLGGNSAKKGLKHVGMFMKSGIRFFNTHGWRLI